MAAAMQNILMLRQANNAAIAAHDLQPVLHTWKENVHITRGNGNFITDRQAMQAALEKEFADASFVSYCRMPEKISISGDGSMASEQGNWKGVRIQDNRPLQTTGVYMAMWKRENDTWRIGAELYIALATGAGE